MENRKINAETKSQGNKLSTRTNTFHQLFHACWNHPSKNPRKRRLIHRLPQ